jgi:Mala s 1-like protein
MLRPLVSTALATLALFVGSARLAGPAVAADRPVAHRVIAQDKGHVAILNAKGEVEWEVPCDFTSHDIQVLPNGNMLLHTGPATVVEMTPAKQVVWQYVSQPKAGYDGPVEIHAFQRLKDGTTMIAESGNRRIIEVDREGKIVREVPLTVEHPNAHRDTRLVRKLANGHYLVCHEGDGVVREYDATGKVVWSYALDLNGREATPGHDGHGTNVFGAIRLTNGNTLIAGGNNNRVLEVTPAGKIVWSVEQNELPGIHLFWVTTLEMLPKGHLIIGNTHAGPDNPQLIEITRDKRVVWMLKNFDALGNDTAAAQVLDVKGSVIR